MLDLKSKTQNICCLQVIHCKYKDTNKKKAKSWKKVSNTNLKKIKLDLRTKAIHRDEEGLHNEKGVLSWPGGSYL
jgi:hypothetical protein